MFLKELVSQSAGVVEHTDCTSAMGYDFPIEYLRYQAKLSDGELSVKVDLWGMRSTPLLTLFPSPLTPGLVAPERVLPISQTKLNCVLKLN